MPDGRPLLEREDLPPGDKNRIGRAVASLLGWWIVAIAALAALVVWHLVRRGRVLRANLDPPRIVSLPDEFERPPPPRGDGLGPRPDEDRMPSARFRPHERINDPAIFRLAFASRRSVSDPALIVYGVENGLPYPRLGISASRRKVRMASDRNRVKRLLREAFRLAKADLPIGVNLIVVPRGPGLTFDQARRSLPGLARDVARRLGRRAAKPSP